MSIPAIKDRMGILRKQVEEQISNAQQLAENLFGTYPGESPTTATDLIPPGAIPDILDAGNQLTERLTYLGEISEFIASSLKGEGPAPAPALGSLRDAASPRYHGLKKPLDKTAPGQGPRQASPFPPRPTPGYISDAELSNALKDI